MKAKNFLMATLSGFIVMASAQASYAAQGSFELRFHLDSHTDYTQESPGVFVGGTDTESSSMSVTGIDPDGNKFAQSFGPETISAISTDRLTIQGNVITSQTKEGQTVVTAEVNNESEIRVSSQEMTRVMAESLKAKGKNLVTALELQSSEGEAAFKLNISDLVCKKTVPMVCAISVDLMVRAGK